MLLDFRPHVQKPSFGSVEINWGHPLAQGLVGYFLLNEQSLPADFVNGLRADLFVGGQWTPQGPRTSNANDRIRFPASSQYRINGDVPWSLAFSLFKTGNTASGADGYVSTRTAFGDGMWEVYEGANIHFAVDAGIDLSLATAPAVGQHTITIARTVGGTYNCFIDASVSGTASSATVPKGASERLLIGALGEDATNLNVFGIWNWVAVYSRTLSRDDHLRLLGEPYDFLRPVVRRHYVKVSAAAAGSVVTPRSLALLGVGA